jgi:hypothetical protein
MSVHPKMMGCVMSRFGDMDRSNRNPALQEMPPSLSSPFYSGP